MFVVTVRYNDGSNSVVTVMRLIDVKALLDAVIGLEQTAKQVRCVTVEPKIV